jgi:hypothetical protein
LANPQNFRLSAVSVIFIDKLNVSGIEIMILDWRLQKTASSVGNRLASRRQQRDILIVICRGLAAT